MFLVPEIIILIAALSALMAEVFVGKRYPMLAYFIAQITFVVVFIWTVMYGVDSRTAFFDGGFIRDQFGDVLKLVIYAITALTLIYSQRYLIDRGMMRGEFYAMILFAVLGMQVLISAGNLLTIYMGLEIMSLSIYALVAWRRQVLTVTEAAMKYFVLGSIASGMLLYGMSLVYGATGSLSISTIAYEVIAQGLTSTLVFQFGLVFLLVGVAFKVGLVPFHMWMPDVYQGAPSTVTLFIATASKLAAFSMLIRLWVEALGTTLESVQTLLIVLAVLSIIIGNVIAIAQHNLKRMLAYSAIAHMGFMLLGILSGSQEGYAAAMYYAIIYAVMGTAGFGLLTILADKSSERDTFDDIQGLATQSPWLAALMLVVMFSMAGIPPTVGFYAKLTVLQAVIQADLVWLAILAVVFSVVGAFYYLRVIKKMFFDQPKRDTPIPSLPVSVKLFATANVAALVLFGIFPEPIIRWCQAAFGL